MKVSHPQDVEQNDLDAASLVLVDFKLERWAERDNLSSLSLKPKNGLALLSVLQEAAVPGVRAFALFTQEVSAVSKGLAPLPHIVARAHSIEWVFDKKRGGRPLEEVCELASCTQSLSQTWQKPP